MQPLAVSAPLAGSRRNSDTPESGVGASVPCIWVPAEPTTSQLPSPETATLNGFVMPLPVSAPGRRVSAPVTGSAAKATMLSEPDCATYAVRPSGDTAIARAPSSGPPSPQPPAPPGATQPSGPGSCSIVLAPAVAGADPSVAAIAVASTHVRISPQM